MYRAKSKNGGMAENEEFRRARGIKQEELAAALWVTPLAMGGFLLKPFLELWLMACYQKEM